MNLIKKPLTLFMFSTLFTASAQQPASTENPDWKKTDGLYAQFNTAKGEIVVRLEFQKVPLTVSNFVALAEGNHPMQSVKPKGTPFYDGTVFHRCIPNFMIQGGDPQGTGMGNAGYSFADEIESSLKHSSSGILSMANSGPNTNGSQFFITHKETPWLDGKHAIFGKLVLGQKVVDAMTNGDTLKTLRIIRVGAEAKKFDAPKVFTESEGALKKKQEEARKAAAAEFERFVKQNYPNAQKTPSGLWYDIKEQGAGDKPLPGKTVVVNYTGSFVDGKKFDSNTDPQFGHVSPFEFPLGQGRVIKGWDEGIGLLNVGSKATLIIPYFLAYGENGRPPQIPAKSTLIFDVELTGIK